jgi:hypothetical protein
VSGPIDSAISALAHRQHGNVTREQLLDLGLGPAAITYRSRTGDLHRVHRGVFAVGRPPATPLERAAAAVLACGRRAALSHQSALTLWGFQEHWPTRLHVTVAGDRRRPLIVVHRCASLLRADVRIQLGIRVTSPARTLLDCAPGLTRNRLVQTAADARRAGLLHPGALEDVAERFPHHAGCAHLAPLLESPTRARARSGLEIDFLTFCARFGLPTPMINTTFNGYEVDALFAPERLIVEADGWDFHRDRYMFESDRERDAHMLAAGVATVRITRERLVTAPGREAERLGTILEQRKGG